MAQQGTDPEQNANTTTKTGENSRDVFSEGLECYHRMPAPDTLMKIRDCSARSQNLLCKVESMIRLHGELVCNDAEHERYCWEVIQVVELVSICVGKLCCEIESSSYCAPQNART